jgi:hypothetical protein
MVARKRLIITLHVFFLSYLTEWVVSSGKTSHIFWRFLIRISAKAPDKPIVIETFVVLPLILRASPAHGELSPYLFSGVLLSIIPNFCRVYTGELSRHFSGNWRQIFSTFLLGCLTENYLDILSDSSPWIFSTLVGILSAVSRLISRHFVGGVSREVSRYFVDRFTVNFIDKLLRVLRLIISIFCRAPQRNVFPLLFP